MTHSLKLTTLKKRPQFVALRAAVDASGNKIVTPAFIVQFDFIEKAEELPTVHFGVTATKKLGNAVQRNRAKRRLRAAMRNQVSALRLSQDLHIVLIARHTVLDYDFTQLEANLKRALKRINKTEASA